MCIRDSDSSERICGLKSRCFIRCLAATYSFRFLNGRPCDTRRGRYGEQESQKPERKMGLATPRTSFECEIADGLAHVILSRPDRGNPIDGDFCREFSLGMAELSERDDVRAVLMSARGKLFSVGGDLVALGGQ